MFENIKSAIEKNETITKIGKIEKVLGMTIESSGGEASVGDIVLIYNENEKREVLSEVVGFRDGKTLLMPYENVEGLSPGSFVRNTNKRLQIPVGPGLMGRTIDSMRNPIDGLGSIEIETYYPIQSSYTNPLDREIITEKLEFGVKAVDGFLTIGKGQRIGIFAGSGVGKSTLMGMIARNVKADINIIALVGERGREVREFLVDSLGEEGLKRSVVVVATSDQPVMQRLKCPLAATAIAEYFRDKGKDVLLMMDNLTRFAMAQREIGLATGEPPIARGYTSFIYVALPKLLERSGNFKKGSITGVYAVLVEGDDTNEPISDTARGILDGHIVLTRRLANSNHFPAIDINMSISRLMNIIVSEEHMNVASKLRDWISIYDSNLDLISIGAYKPGKNEKLDMAIGKIDTINSFLKQGIYEKYNYEETLDIMKKII